MAFVLDASVTMSQAFGPVFGFARQTGVSLFDACFLELAIRQGLPLATADERLGTTAEPLGVPVP